MLTWNVLNYLLSFYEWKRAIHYRNEKPYGTALWRAYNHSAGRRHTESLPFFRLLDESECKAVNNLLSLMWTFEDFASFTTQPKG